MNNLDQVQSIHGKGGNICININREENYNQILDVEDHTLHTLQISLIRPYSLPHIPLMIPIA